MTIFLALLVACVPGLAGGLVNAVTQLADSGKSEQDYAAAKGVPLWLFVVSQCAVGVGGALAFMLVLIWVGKFPDTPAKPSEWLFLITLSFVAGFVGHRILTRVAARLEKQVEDELQKRLPEVKAEVARKEVDPKMRAALAVMSAFTNLSNKKGVLPQTFTEDVRELEAARKDLPLHRQVNIVLGRLYAEGLSDLDRAIAVLSEFIEKKTAAGQGADKDTADSLFNRACYYSHKAKDVSGEEADRLKKLALADLEASIRLAPENIEDAKEDPDLAPIRETGQFKNLLEKGNP